MASVIEQFRDLFVFAYGEKCDLDFVMPIFRLGEKKKCKSPEGRPAGIIYAAIGGFAYDKY